ncbi:MAG: MarR family transcriptional regulator [Actinomycetota bacterium]
MARSDRPSPAAVDAWHAVLLARGRLLPLLDADLQETHGLSLDWYDVLYQLRQAGTSLTMGQLGDRLLVGASRCSRRIDRMAEAGLVERHRDDGDARIVNVSLTSDGRALGRRAGATHLRSIQRHFGRFVDDDAAATIGETLAGVVANAEV